MNWKNKKLAVTVRVLLGLMFFGSGVAGMLGGKIMQGVPEPMIPLLQALWAMGIFQMIKITEIVAGLMLVIGFWPALATIFVSPICVGIIVFDLSVAPEYLLSGVVVSVLTAYLGYVYFDKYRPMFSRN